MVGCGDQLVVSWLNGDIITKKEGYSYSGIFTSFVLIMGWEENHGGMYNKQYISCLVMSK